MWENRFNLSGNTSVELFKKDFSGYNISLLKNGFWYSASGDQFKNIDSDLKYLKTKLNLEFGNINGDYKKPSLHDTNSLFSEKNNSPLDSTPDTEKVSLLEDIKLFMNNCNDVSQWSLKYHDRFTQIHYSNSDLIRYQYNTNHFQISLIYTVTNHKDYFRDSYEEFHLKFEDFNGFTNRIKSEIDTSLKFLSAKDIIAGKYDLLLAPSVTGMFIHECLGHQLEQDWAYRWKTGQKIGPENFSVIDDGSIPETAGFTPIDYEGNINIKKEIISKGTITTFLNSNKTVHGDFMHMTGNARSISLIYLPKVRMTCTYVKNGNQSFEKLLSQVKDGLYIVDCRQGFGFKEFVLNPVRAFVIKDGEITEPVKIQSISDDVFSTIQSIVGIGDDLKIENLIIGGCDKGNQRNLPISYGGPHVLLKDIKVN